MGERSELGLSLDEREDLVPEQLLDLGGRGERVLDGVVQEAGDDARLVELQLGEQAGHLERMDEVGLARLPHLALMDLGAVDVGLLDEVQVCVRAVLSDALQNVVQPDHRAA